MGSTLIDKGLLHIVLLHLARKVMWSKFPNQGVDMFGNSARLGEVKTSPWKRSLFLLTVPTPGNILFGGRGKALVKFSFSEKTGALVAAHENPRSNFIFTLART